MDDLIQNGQWTVKFSYEKKSYWILFSKKEKAILKL